MANELVPTIVVLGSSFRIENANTVSSMSTKIDITRIVARGLKPYAEIARSGCSLPSGRKTLILTRYKLRDTNQWSSAETAISETLYRHGKESQ